MELLYHKEFTHKQLEMHGCILSAMATGVLVLKHQAISDRNADGLVCNGVGLVSYKNVTLTAKILIFFMKKKT